MDEKGHYELPDLTKLEGVVERFRKNILKELYRRIDSGEIDAQGTFPSEFTDVTGGREYLREAYVPAVEEALVEIEEMVSTAWKVTRTLREDLEAKSDS